jgi:hypothetical protein
MRRATRDRAAGIAALVAVAALVVGVPILLVRIAGWPLPTSVPDWERVRRAVSQGDIPANVVVNGLAVIVWLIWFQLVWALVWELAVNVPRLTAGHATRPAPLVPISVGSGVGRLVALILTIGTAIASTPTPAIALPATPTGDAPPPPPTSIVLPTTAARPSPPASLADGPRWKVERTDSLWKIAEATLGDGERATEILDHNQWLGSPRHLKAGQILTLPADATVPTDRQPAPPPLAEETLTASTPGDSGVSYLDAAHIVVEPGDTLWDLTAERLAAVDDDVTAAETIAHLNDVVASNPDVIEDPDLIYPGEVIAFPAVGTPPQNPPPPVDSPPVEAQPLPPPAAPTATPPADGDPIPPLTAADPATDVASVAPTTTMPPPQPTTRHEPPTAAPSTTPTHQATEPSTSKRPAVPLLAGITGATALASGLLLRYRRRLAVRAARGAAAYRAAVPRQPAVLTAVTRAADVPLLRWANAQLAGLTQRLRPGDIDGQPLAVELSETSGIEMLWTAPNRQAPQPWNMRDDGWTWTLPYDPDAAVDNSDRAAAIPALVTIGARDGNQLLLNLEAAGTVAVDGEDQPAADFVRSLVAELAAGDILSDAYLVTCGVEVGQLAGLDRVQRGNRDAARESLSAAANASRAFLADYGLPSAFAARLGGDAAGREATVVAVDDEYAEPLDAGVTAGLSASLVYTGARAAGGVCIRINDDGTAVLDPYGIEFDAAGLPLPTVEVVSDLLDEPAEGSDPSVAEPAPADAPVGEPDEPVDDLGDVEDDWQMPEPAVLVRVLGAPEVVGVDLGRIEISIVAYLACHGGKRRDEQVINAVWNGRTIEQKTLWNKVSKIRSKLGQELVPPRLPNSSNVVLSEHVMTDLEILTRLLARADQVAECEGLQLLLQGLDLIDGVPFDSAEYDWAFETQDHAAACETVEAATLRCVDIAMNLGDLVAARHAVTQGLRALPMNEPLYRARMRIEAASGNADGIRQALAELGSALADRSEGVAEATPEPATVRLAGELTAAAQR